MPDDPKQKNTVQDANLEPLENAVLARKTAPDGLLALPDGVPDESTFRSAHTDFKNAFSYGDYLALDELLGAQRTLTDAHDERVPTPISIAKHWRKQTALV